MVFVAFRHAYGAVDKGVAPFGVVGQRHIAVAFLVGLVDHVETVIVEEGIHLRSLGVVACADGVEVVTLEHDIIFNHRFQRHGFAMARVYIVVVGAFEHRERAVDINFVIAYFHLAEAVLLRRRLYDVAVGVEHFDVDGV